MQIPHNYVKIGERSNYTVAAKKIKTADLHDKVLLPRSFELGFDPVMRDVGASAPAVWYAGRFAKPRC